VMQRYRKKFWWIIQPGFTDLRRSNEGDISRNETSFLPRRFFILALGFAHLMS